MNNRNKNNNSISVTRFYLVLIFVSIIIMVIAAYITYGDSPRVLHISLDKSTEKIDDTNKKSNPSSTINIGTDLSRVPSDETVEDILNDAIPDVCDDCNLDNTLECLEEYEVNQILIQNPGHQDHLFIELITGSDEEVYTVVIDLNDNNKILDADGKIDDNVCINSDVDLVDGGDEIYSKYLNTTETK